MTEHATPKRRLLDLLLAEHGGLGGFVATRRDAGVSWRLIERELHAEHDIDITYETLRKWFPEYVEQAS